MEPKKVEINSEFIRLDAMLKLAGAFVTGGQAKEAIQGGQVLVNGEPCTMRGKKMRPGDKARYQDQDYEVSAG
jgi:ribosome-associated protein